MSVIVLVLGLAFLISGILSLAGITDMGLQIAELTRMHTLSFLGAYPASWIYIGLGLLLVIVGYAISPRKK